MGVEVLSCWLPKFAFWRAHALSGARTRSQARVQAPRAFRPRTGTVMSAPHKKTRVAFFGTHPQQFNGYSKVVYELSHALAARGRLELLIFGFQKFYDHPAHRRDLPPGVEVFDAAANETPRSQGFGFSSARAWVEEKRPDVVVLFNDLVVITNLLRELGEASNRPEFRIVAYVDQVYRCQRRDLLQQLEAGADEFVAFTPMWRECLASQLTSKGSAPIGVLPHAFNPRNLYPVPQKLARRAFHIPEGDFVVMNLNRNQPRKRWDTCLQAFAEVVVRRPNSSIRLLVGTEARGAWDLPEIYERELRKRGVAEGEDLANAMSRLIFPGHPQMLSDEETNFLYNVADVGINTCDGEGFGLCNFDQAGLGVPQVVPRIGGFLHFFDDDCATLIEPCTTLYVDASRDGIGGEAQITHWRPYADAILRYHDDPALRDRHARAARERVSGMTWDAVAREFEELVIPPPPPPPAATATAHVADEQLVVPPVEPPAAAAAATVSREEYDALKARLDALLARFS